MNSFTDSEARLRDLRLVLHHENAHLHVARAAGLWGRVEIHHNPNGGAEEKHWTGQFQLFGQLEARQWRARRMIGLAGSVAELLLNDPQTDEYTLADYLEADPAALSDTDRSLAGDFTVQDVRRTLSIVRRLWPQISADVEKYLPHYLQDYAP